jgi:hypothetical protein
MNTKLIGLAVCLVALNAMGIAVASNSDGVAPPVASNVTPELFENWQSGDAYFEAQQAGGGTSCGQFAWKIDENPLNIGYDTSTAGGTVQKPWNTPVELGPTITIGNNTGTTFDWSISSGYTVCAVIVKAGPDALVYRYAPEVSSDTGLYTPTNPNNGGLYEISHITFVFNEADSDVCYQEETAWTLGTRYVNRGNWAMYSSFEDLADGVVIIAGGGSIGTPIGFATLVDNNDGTATITIQLMNAIFNYDVTDPYGDNNLKVQDYAKAPTKTPAPGQFDWKKSISAGGTQGSIVVPVNRFYGIHLDVNVIVPCP